MELSTEKLYRPFADEYRDYGRTVITAIIRSVPELGDDRWWEDLKAYQSANPGRFIIDTSGKTPTTAFDHNGVAKWFLNLYVEEGSRVNRYLYQANSPQAFLLCSDELYSRGLAAYMELRNSFLGHAGEEELSPDLLLGAASLTIWLVENLYRADQPGQPPLTQKECTRFALLAEYAYRSGSALGTVMLYVCYHFGVGVPQSFRQAVYFARLALAGLAAPENTGLLQHPDDESSHSFWQRALFSYIAGDCLRARLQTRSRDTLYDPYCLDMTELFDMLAILPECLSAAVREPSDKKDSANLIQIVLQCIRQTMDRPFADELKQDAHQKFLYADRNLQANPQAARENWVSAVNLYVQAALLGDAEGAAGVGYCCEHHPLGSSQATRELALSWYRQAAKMGSGWAMERVGQYYAMGLCGTADPQLAQQCYDQARRMGQPVKA